MCQVYPLLVSWSLLDVDFCVVCPYAVLCCVFVFRASILLVFLMLLSSWSKCALEGVDNGSIVLMYFRSIFPTWCVSNGVHTMVLVLICFCCGPLSIDVACCVSFLYLCVAAVCFVVFGGCVTTAMF